MFEPLLMFAASTFLLALVLHRQAIRLGFKWKLLDIPTSRRRHIKPTPIIGGLGIFIAWGVSLTIYCFHYPEWYEAVKPTLFIVTGGVLTLMLIGIVDDLRGLSPKVKLLVEFLVAAFVLVFEPNIHQLMLHWQDQLGIFVWALGLIWIVGITNAINLIDGLDGLAAGTSLLVAGSILVLSVWSGDEAQFGIVAISLLIPAIMSFLRFNWNPAKIFLGDNGSLALGFMLATTSLMCRPQSKSWVMIASVILMLGYPIMDMGLSVIRRRKNHLPLFKADRTHLHFRVLRIGLTVKQTSFLLLSISLFLQVCALSINLMSPPTAALGITVVCFSISTLLFVIMSVERWRVRVLANRLQENRIGSDQSPVERHYTLMKIDLVPLLEVGVFEEEERCQKIMSALELMIRSTLKRTDRLIITKNHLIIVLADLDYEDQQSLESVQFRYKEKITSFLELYNLQVSLASLPITFEKRSMILHEGESAGADLPKLAA